MGAVVKQEESRTNQEPIKNQSTNQVGLYHDECVIGTQGADGADRVPLYLFGEYICGLSNNSEVTSAHVQSPEYF